MKDRAKVVFLMPATRRRAELWTPEAQKLAEDLGLEVQLAGEDLSPEAVRQADALITSWGSPLLDGRYLDAAPSLKIVGHAAGSVQRVAGPELFERGVRIVSANAEMARCVARWSLMMTLIAARRMLSSCNFGNHRALRWKAPDEPLGLHRATVGIWGYGAISRELIKLLRCAGVEQILIASNYIDEREVQANGLIQVGLEELFSRSDIVHLLTSLTPARVGRIDAQMLARLRDGATLINAGRAHLVDEEALMSELRSGRISACLDVYHQEPLPADHPVRTLSNAVLTPHNAGTGSRDQYVPIVLREIDRFFRGEPLRYEVTAQHAAAMTTEYAKLA